MLDLRYYSLVQGIDGKGQVGTITVGVTQGGMVCVHTRGGMHVLLDEFSATELIKELQDAVKRVADHRLSESRALNEGGAGS